MLLNIYTHRPRVHFRNGWAVFSVMFPACYELCPLWYHRSGVCCRSFCSQANFYRNPEVRHASIRQVCDLWGGVQCRAGSNKRVRMQSVCPHLTARHMPCAGPCHRCMSHARDLVMLRMRWADMGTLGTLCLQTVMYTRVAVYVVWRALPHDPHTG